MRTQRSRRRRRVRRAPSPAEDPGATHTCLSSQNQQPEISKPKTQTPGFALQFENPATPDQQPASRKKKQAFITPASDSSRWELISGHCCHYASNTPVLHLHCNGGHCWALLTAVSLLKRAVKCGEGTEVGAWRLLWHRFQPVSEFQSPFRPLRLLLAPVRACFQCE